MPSLFCRNVVGSYLAFFIPLNISSWLCFGLFGGITVFLLSCFLLILFVIKYGVFYYNIYIFLFGISAIVGYKLLLNQSMSKSQLTTGFEAFDVDKNTLSLRMAKKDQDIDAANARLKRYGALKDITEDLGSTLDAREIANVITDRAFNIVGRSDRALLFLINEEKQELGLFASKQADGISVAQVKKGEIFDNWIVKHRRALIVEDTGNDFRFSPEALRDKNEKDYRSIIGAPLMSGMKVTGVLRMDSKKSASYTQDDLRLLNIISDLAAASMENAALYERTSRLAITDGLTGLYVQRYFKERLDMEFKKALRHKKGLSILMIDLDYFKACNDKYGHAAGDILLCRVSQALRENIAPGHIIARYGGEEFALILLMTDKRSAIGAAEVIRRKIEESVFVLRRDEIRITVSIGISSFPDDGDNPVTVLKKADANLYKAKQNGRNRLWPDSF